MQSLRSQQGYLLIEILLAIIIISIALMTIGGLFLQSGKSANTSTEYTTAANLAQKQFELLKVRQQGTNPLLTTTTIYPFNYNEWLDNHLRDAATSSYPVFSVKTTAVQCTEQNSSNLLEVTVTVSWNNKQNVSTQVPFTTLFPKVPPPS